MVKLTFPLLPWIGCTCVWSSVSSWLFEQLLYSRVMVMDSQHCPQNATAVESPVPLSLWHSWTLRLASIQCIQCILPCFITCWVSAGLNRSIPSSWASFFDQYLHSLPLTSFLALTCPTVAYTQVWQDKQQREDGLLHSLSFDYSLNSLIVKYCHS